MKIRCTYDEVVDASTLIPHPKNPNQHSADQVVRLARILEYQGWRYPIKVSRLSGYVTSGHGRLLAAKHNGWDKVPVNYQEYESEEQEYADLVSDNAIAEWAELDLKSINAEIPELGPDFDIDMLGLKDFTIDVSEKMGDGDPDEVPETKPAIVKTGELYILGNHRLLCGDSTKKEDIERLMGGERADMVFTDPPYNLGFKYQSYEDDKSDVEYLSFCGTWFSVLKKFAAKIIITPGTKNTAMWCRIEEPTGIACWVKKNWVTSCKISNLQQWEPIFFYGPFERSRGSDLYEVNRVYQKDVADGHPCPKQVELVEDILEHYAGKTVLDVFGGSGTTLIAAEKLGKVANLVELDPIYCGVILDRWAKFTGLDPHREDGIAWSEIKANH